MKNTHARKLIALAGALVRGVTLFCVPALASAPTAKQLNGTWVCTNAYDLYWGNQILDDVTYTFWGISGNKGQFRYENRTQRDTITGTFRMAKEGNETWIYMDKNGFEEWFRLTWIVDGSTIMLETPDIYFGQFKKK